MSVFVYCMQNTIMPFKIPGSLNLYTLTFTFDHDSDGGVHSVVLEFFLLPC